MDAFKAMTCVENDDLPSERYPPALWLAELTGPFRCVHTIAPVEP